MELLRKLGSHAPDRAVALNANHAYDISPSGLYLVQI
jgi:hypothetical protein